MSSLITFNNSEQEWVVRITGKLAENLPKTDGRRAIAKNMHKLFKGEGGLQFNLNRKKLRLLQALVEGSVSVLENTTIPGYTKRLNAEPKKYAPYLQRAKERVEMLKILLEKIEEGL